MSPYSLAAILLSVAAVISYINARWLRMYPSSALMLGALVISALLWLLQAFGLHSMVEHAHTWVVRSDFQHLLLNGFLSFLLFAGSLQLDIKQVKKYFSEIVVLAGFSTLLSAFLITFILYFLAHLFALPLTWVDCALFGALISPTDPVAVLSAFKHLKAPKELTVCISGEALFNDGVGIVLFLTLLSLLNNYDVSVQSVATLFLREAIGGVVFGVVLGWLGERMLRTIEDTSTAVFITIALVAGGYALAQHWEISGPLAMVVAGLMVEHEIEYGPEAVVMRRNLTMFWSSLDDILNAILFTLLGFEMLVVKGSVSVFSLAAIMVLATLAVRWLVVAIPTAFFARRRKHSAHFVKILTFGGLRGGLALALALSLPVAAARNEIICITFVIVAVSVLLQSRLVARWLR